MTPAVHLALAYVYATGDLPKHIRMPTYMEARKHMERANFMATGRFHYVTLCYLDKVREHPLARAHDYLTHHGFTVSQSRRGTSHYVGYDKEGYEAVAYRGGGATIYKLNSAPPYREGTRLSVLDVMPPYA